MANWEERLQRLMQAIRERFTTTEAVLLGVCAYLARQFGIPVAIVRLIGLTCLYFWPIITTLVYVIARFIVDVTDDDAY